MPDSDNGPLGWLTDRISNSLAWLFAVVALFVTCVGWGCLANSYGVSHNTAGSQLPGDDVVGKFIALSIEQLPNASTVITWHTNNRFWLLTLVILAEVAVIAGFFVFKRVETALAEPRHPPTRRS